MSKEREALKLALEALEYPLNQSHENFNVDMAELISHRAITAIKEALAQPEQDPVATVESVATVVSESGNQEVTMSWWHEPALPVGTKLYTTPSHRKPLTDDEIDKLPWEPHEGNPMTFAEGLRYFARAIEAAHGIKE